MTETILTNDSEESDNPKKIAISDIQQKIRDTIGKNPITTVAIPKQSLLLKLSAAVLVVISAYILGRSQGKNTSTILEVKRV